MSKKIFFQDVPQEIGKKIDLYGWVHSIRAHGKITFLDVRDHTGIVQVVVPLDGIHPTFSPEDVVHIVGKVAPRPEHLINKKIKTGAIEVQAEKSEIISPSQPPPFPIDTSGYDIGEDIRLEYRYLDLRRQRMQRNILIRSAFVQEIRTYLMHKSFTEIDTPMLTKSTPEGARDFIIPSRLQKGKFYALPQSPQQYKQLLMVAGFERYFQIARCFRDESQRADRAYGEFTQLDMEMSFVEQNDILELVEDMFTTIVKKLFPEKNIIQSPWPRIPHAEALKKYGTDKPDLRKNKKDPNELAFCWTVDFPLFTKQSQDDFFHGSGKATFAPSHNMFTSPHPDDIGLLDTNPLKTRGIQHDLVLNGFEIGGGSIRIHKPDIQQKIFDLIGFSKKQKQEFSHMLTAFTYGVPPHGGIAPGIDRALMALLGEPSVREVIPFPTSASGKTAVMSAPSEVTAEQLAELGIRILDE
ncbi:aspartate--tRNA ligase [Candidatus Roizmanbacteria bacterium CG10_big_fil_rev_8_21_14_0_10_39_6]|uniref:Aspartate--tRNA(Asp/Asn) ligase n=1 Tax=Candidatus Roizmanbacteria bacterium CG10_big_fil_rev_8_21_14_0_10_39_6 TaxID=1974853 RepID=A0A2M8KS19_9BACT|nr:MAG: aspartate--tRNA ligase [Candidatus Roizmanbacteria bacterium CG10_big_fil_rev_8_21_14_0_10_39_6]